MVLSLDDLVALSGAHTIGFACYAAFQNRIHNFNTTHNVDPTLCPNFASKLQGKCLLHNTVKTAGAPMDPYSATFDNNYHKLVLHGKSLFSSDQAQLGFPKTKALVNKYASSKQAFWQAFTNSIAKLSSINGGQEIRKNCRIVN
ncbi:hypothetical protein TIFTF001_002227 [Ficus carica]|uniref:peroxidase n=1 Tax=Ficus carica TaxID=3494 RepID=A0AA88CNX0_FICCA|nr:hypothetical protein TIFTF001_002227 [Ficus carica]